MDPKPTRGFDEVVGDHEVIPGRLLARPPASSTARVRVGMQRIVAPPVETGTEGFCSGYARTFAVIGGEAKILSRVCP